METIIRDAGDLDLDRMLPLLDELHGGSDATIRKPTTGELDAWRQIRADPLHHVLLAQGDTDVPVGSLDLLIVNNLTRGGRPFGLIENVIVRAAARRQGVGRQLMEASVSRAREAGCYKVQFLSNRGRTSAHAFYEAIGFEQLAAGFRMYLDERS